jgi:transcriptional regulator of acetoin/glycerol metabolism
MMGRLERCARLISAAAQHDEHVFSVAEGAAPRPDIEELSISWQRSANSHRVDPVDSKAPRVLTPRELKDFREPLGKLILGEQEEIDRLYKVVREAGYTVLFCDTAGVAVEHRGEDSEASRFEYWGAWLGGVWSEEIEGTTGIGTCIAEERPVTVHRSQHFRSRHMDLSCSGAPIFGVDGRLLAVLDVSAIDPGRSEQAHALTGALTKPLCGTRHSTKARCCSALAARSLAGTYCACLTSSTISPSVISVSATTALRPPRLNSM